MPTSFFDLPAELREQIYREVLSTKSARRYPPANSDLPPYYRYDLSLLSVNRLVHKETQKIFQDNIFVKITTPWAQSIHHINNEGKVPVVSEGPKAAAFSQYHLHIYVGTPNPALAYEQDTVSMLTCLEDLPAFTKMWRYSNLNYRRDLNLNLTLELTIQDPHVPTRKLPKHLQEALLLPFGAVKGLAKFSVQGTHLLPSVSQRLADLRAEEEPSVETCLATAESLKNEANTQLAAGKYQEALTLYTRSFAAIHIEVDGRTRHIHADGYFQTDLTSGPDREKRADYVRMILRVRLVANVIFAYLKLRQFDEAYFWGKRSILLFRHSMTGDQEDEIDYEGSYGRSEGERHWIEHLGMMQFPAQSEMGKIFYRTALAAKELGGKEARGVRTLMRAASVYLPRDENVQKEWQSLEQSGRTNGETNGSWFSR